MHIGNSVGPYHVLRQLGSGGMGEVWLAEDTRLRRQVALKTVRTTDAHDAASRTRLMREARAAAALNHAHIATVHDVIEAEGEVIVVFEYVEGETLQARIARGLIPVPEAVDIASQIAKALVAAHSHGVIHRDLKPANVILGADRHVKVLDFGIARILAVGTTQTTPREGPESSSGFGFIGTASYAAPEQMVSSAVDERADLYALGVVLFEMLSGQRPFQGSDPVQLASTKLGKDAPPLSSTGELVPPALEQLVASMLARERDRRPQSAKEVLTQLRAISGDRGTGPLPSNNSRSAVIAVGAAILIVLLGAYGVRETRRFTSTPATNESAPPVIAVLPLANNSGDPSKDFIAAGIAESLISSLAAVPSVTVLSRASVADARSRIKDQDALTKDLGATFLVEGSVQQSGGTLRVSLNLIRADRSIAWGDSIEGTFEKIFDLQSRLASALTSALVVRVSAAERERMNAQPTTSPEALSAYWRGVALMERFDLSGNVDSAISSYQQAIDIDPRFALAHAALGRAYWEKYTQTKEPEWTKRALDSGATALRVDSTLPEVRLVMATILNGTGRYREAIEELTQALGLRPNYDDARRLLGQVLARQGQIDMAVAEFKKAITLRPTFWLTYSNLGNALLPAARYNEAIEAFTTVTTLQPDNYIGYQQLGTVYQTIGRRDEALLNYQRAIALRPNPQAYSNTGSLQYERGDYQAAVEAYRSAIQLRPNAAATHRNLGDALSKLGRRDEASAAYFEAVRLAEEGLKVNPKDARATASLAIYLAKAGRVDDARKRVTEALSQNGDDIEVLYRVAVAETLSNDRAMAMACLEKAVRLGYSRASIASTDEFAPLSGTPTFRSLIARIEKEPAK